MIKLQENLTTGEISLQKINPSGQQIFEKSLTPYPANALTGANFKLSNVSRKWGSTPSSK